MSHRYIAVVKVLDVGTVSDPEHADPPIYTFKDDKEFKRRIGKAIKDIDKNLIVRVVYADELLP